VKININNREEWIACMNLLIAFGYVWHRSSDALTDIDVIERRWYRDYPNINVKEKTKSIAGGMSSYGGGLSIVDDSVKIINHLSGIGAPITINNVAGFDAIVEEGRVLVGCQKISLEEFREIEAAAKVIRG